MIQRKNKALPLFALLATILLNISSYCFAQEKIKAGFYELPPYISASLEKHGIIGFLLEKATADKAVVEYIPIASVRLPYLLNTEEITVGVNTVDSLCNKTAYKCSETIKTISVVLAYKPENTEFDNISALDELRTNINYIGQTKENIWVDKNNAVLEFKKTKDVAQGLDLLKQNRLKGFLINEDMFDFKKTHKEIDPSMKKTKPLTQFNLRFIIKNGDKAQWILDNISSYMQKNKYDGVWLDYYINYAE